MAPCSSRHYSLFNSYWRAPLQHQRPFYFSLVQHLLPWLQHPISAAMELLAPGGIIPCMRRMLSFFLVVLLALRGLAGDAMAMGTLPAMGAALQVTAATAPADDAHAAHSPTADSAHAAPTSSSPAGPATDADLLALHHHSPAPHDAPSASAPAAEHCATEASAPGCGDHSHGAPCAACVICHSAVSPTALQVAAPVAPAHGQPVGAPAHFASAQPLQASKPPIS